MEIDRKSIRVSIDVGCHRHRVAVGLSNGEVMDEFDINHASDGFDDFFTRIDRHRRVHHGEVLVAMEGYNGWARPLDTLVRTHGYRLFNINNLKLARFKEIFPAASKSDPVDARKGLELFQLADHLPLARGVLQEVLDVPVEHEMLKRLTRRRRALVDERTRVLNRLQSDLQSVCPELLGLTSDAGNVWFVSLLTSRDDLTKLPRLKHKTLLGLRGVGQKYAAAIGAWQKRARFSHDIDWVGPMIFEDARRILDLRQRIKDIEARCETLISQSTHAQVIASLPGFGSVCSAELTGEIGNVGRFKNDGSLAVYLGMANLDNSSGAFRGSKKPRHVNTHARAAMMIAVDQHRKQVPESQRYYEKKRAEGKKHNQAIRSLARHLCRVLFRMLRDQRHYEIRTEKT